MHRFFVAFLLLAVVAYVHAVDVAGVVQQAHEQIQQEVAQKMKDGVKSTRRKSTPL